jgi:hypothetical protein
VFRYSTSFYGAGAPVTWIIQVRPGHGRESLGLRGNVASLAFLLPGLAHSRCRPFPKDGKSRPPPSLASF